MAENTKISPEGLLIWRKIAKKHYVGAPKKFVKPHNVIKVLIFQFWHTPIVFFCKIAIFKNSDLCSNHIYNMNGVSTTFDEFDAEVLGGELLQPLMVHVDEGEEFEEPFDWGEVAGGHGLVEPVWDDGLDSGLGQTQSLHRSVDAAVAVATATAVDVPVERVFLFRYNFNEKVH